MKTLLAGLGRFLAVRRNFIRYSLLTMGTPGLMGVSWLYFAHFADRSILLWFFMIAVVLGAAYVWGVLMWKLFVEDRSKRILDQPTAPSSEPP